MRHGHCLGYEGLLGNSIGHGDSALPADYVMVSTLDLRMSEDSALSPGIQQGVGQAMIIATMGAQFTSCCMMPATLLRSIADIFLESKP